MAHHKYQVCRDETHGKQILDAKRTTAYTNYSVDLASESDFVARKVSLVAISYDDSTPSKRRLFVQRWHVERKAS